MIRIVKVNYPYEPWLVIVEDAHGGSAQAEMFSDWSTALDYVITLIDRKD